MKRFEILPVRYCYERTWHSFDRWWPIYIDRKPAGKRRVYVPEFN